MFCKDSRAEQVLNRFGLDFKFTNKLTQEMLRPGWAQRNLGRSQALLEDAVNDYGQLMLAGSPAPAPIVSLKPDALHNVLDGIQRLSAFFVIGGVEAAAYIVTTDSERAERQLRVLANYLLSGYQESVDWTRRNAVEQLVIQDNGTVEELAAITPGWSVTGLRKLEARLRTGFALRQIAPDLDRLSEGKVDMVAACIPDPELLKKAGKPISDFMRAVDTKWDNDEAEEVIFDFFDGVPKKGLHSHFATKLSKFLADPDVQTRMEGRKPSRQAAGTKLAKHIKSAIRVAQEMVDRGERPLHVDEFRRLDNNLKKLLDRLHRLKPSKSS